MLKMEQTFSLSNGFTPIVTLRKLSENGQLVFEKTLMMSLDIWVFRALYLIIFYPGSKDDGWQFAFTVLVILMIRE